MNAKLAFAIGPMASPAIVALMVIATDAHSGFQSGLGGVLETAAVFLLISAAYSYGFTILFGLPIYVLFIRKGWISYLNFMFAAVLATGFTTVVMLIFQPFEALPIIALPTLFFTLSNASLIWLLLRKPVNQSNKAQQPPAAGTH